VLLKKQLKAAVDTLADIRLRHKAGIADDNVYVFAAHWGISEAVTNFDRSQLNVVPATHSSCGLHL